MAIHPDQIVLGAMAAGGPEATYNPVQVQKLLFLIDREISGEVNGPHFNFVPYCYGPFDPSIYRVLQDLVWQEQVLEDRTGPYLLYSLTESGLQDGLAVLQILPPPVSNYLVRVAAWVRARSVHLLLQEIYARYPDMAVHSRLPQLAATEKHLPERPSALQSVLQGAASVLHLRVTPQDRGGAPTTEDALAGDWWKVGNDLRRAFGLESARPDA